MFNKSEEGGETIIAQGVRLDGEFKSAGKVIIEGEVVGHIETSSDILIGEHASIHADITAHNATIAGQVKGNITVTEKVEIGPTAEISGDITAQVLAIESGARLVGKCAIGEVGTEGKGKKEKNNE